MVNFIKKDRYSFDDLRQIVKILRSKDGCPWDREQTHESMLPNLIEEAYESVDAVERGDGDLMYDELGDLLSAYGEEEPAAETPVKEEPVRVKEGAGAAATVTLPNGRSWPASPPVWRIP